MRRRLLPTGIGIQDLDFAPVGEECSTCGACCSLIPGTDISPPANLGYVELLPGDLAKLKYPKKFIIERPKKSITGSSKYLTVVQDPIDKNYTCPFRQGRTGDLTPCTIYEQRPQACKNFEKGSDACIKFRKEHYMNGAPIRPRLREGVGSVLSEELTKKEN